MALLGAMAANVPDGIKLEISGQILLVTDLRREIQAALELFRGFVSETS
jgi:hypothetical protein